MDFLSLIEDEIVVHPEMLMAVAQAPVLGAEAIGEGPVRCKNYVEEIVPRYSPDEFFCHFRMTRSTLQVRYAVDVCTV